MISAALTMTPVIAQTPPIQTHLAIGLFTSDHSQMITFAFLQTRDGKIIGSRIVREIEFMYAAMGYWPNMCNRAKENLFEKNGIDSCFLDTNDAGKISGWYAQPFQDLWKIRFFENPYLYDQPGWSQGRITPSFVQREFIFERYGIDNILTQYFYGDTLYKLLRDVQSPEWISSYRYASRDTTDTAGTGNQP